MTQVKIKPNESIDLAVRRFKRACDRASVLADVRSKEFYDKPAWVRQRLRISAIKRNEKRVMRERQEYLEKRKKLR